MSNFAHTLTPVLLNPGHAAQAHGLHQTIIDSLSPVEKSFILPKSLSYFFNHLSKSGGNAILGIMNQGALIAQGVIHNPTPDHPDTGMVDMVLPPGPPESFSVLQAVSVHPAWRKKGLMNEIVKQWIMHADKTGCGNLLGEIDVKNIASWSAFLKAGVPIVSIGCDPSDGTVVYNVHAETKDALSNMFNAASGGIAVPLQDIAQQKQFLQNGHKGVAVDAKAGVLFMR